MARSLQQPDVLVLGEHPSTYLCAALLRRGRLRVVHSLLPEGLSPDRRVLINPGFFDLDKSLSGLRRKIELVGLYGVQFLGNQPETRSEHRGKTVMSYSGTYGELRSAMRRLAEDEGADLIEPRSLQIHGLDEQGLEIEAGRRKMKPRVLVLGGVLPEPQQRMLGIPDSWGDGIVHRYIAADVRGATVDFGSRPLLPMSLDVNGLLAWGWLLPDRSGGAQAAVSVPVEMLGQADPSSILSRWLEVLQLHGVVQSTAQLDMANAVTLDLPLAGALAHEGLANRTLLIGPAGGFYSATGEDIYPNCWSAVYAADAVKKALKETHVQDALNPYRQKWRTTLGDYLRGPQQNLRFLLPLVYRNQVMTTRLAESILTGRSVVR